jgi:hypothetical protein
MPPRVAPLYSSLPVPVFAADDFLRVDFFFGRFSSSSSGAGLLLLRFFVDSPLSLRRFFGLLTAGSFSVSGVGMAFGWPGVALMILKSVDCPSFFGLPALYLLLPFGFITYTSSVDNRDLVIYSISDAQA